MKTLLPCLFALLMAGCATQRGFPPQHGVANLDRVDKHVWRGGQPNRLGLEYLHSQGVRTVINLRGADEWPGEREACRDLGILYLHVQMAGFAAPSDTTVRLVLALIRNSNAPVFIHCQHGCDRTGTVIACYRLAQGWSQSEALREAEVFDLSPWERAMRRFILKFKP